MRSVILPLIAACAMAASAQTANFDNVKLKLYGRVRADLFYNSRANEETVDGLFYMYPKDHAYDADGEDLNATAQGSLYMMYSRLGVDISGVKIGNAEASAKIEADFRGSGTSYSVLRLRQAYFNLKFGQSAVLVGQTWHPLFGEISPNVLNLSTGAPFQPFNRSPLIRYRYTAPAGVMLTAAAIWQAQYNSMGPDGKSSSYIKNGNIPEIYASVDYVNDGFAIGAGVDVLSIRPRKQSVVGGKIYKVDERVTSVSAELHAKYQQKNWQISGKTILANNLTHCSMLGGFAVSAINERTGELDYTPFRHSMTWLNFTYGKKWQPGLFAGYLKNFGTGKEIKGSIYGVGTNVSQIVNVSAQMSYNLPHWKIGVEFTPCVAWYGDINKANGRVANTHSVTNYRILGVAMFTF